jgi:hypothetical protein
MKDFKMDAGILIFFLMSSILFLNGCKEPLELQSKWLDKEIVIDANDNDWQDYPFFYNEKTRSRIGVYNNDANLYLCFQTMDEDIQRQILSQGLFVWFNKTGGEEKELCVCFPRGRRLYGLGGPPGRSPDRPDPPTERAPGDRNMPPGRPFDPDSDIIEEIRLFTSDKDGGRQYTFQEAANLGIFVRYTVDQRKRFIYELKIHLAESNKATYAAVESAANKIGIGFMTTKSGGRSKAGGMGREGMGGGGMGGGPRGGMGPSRDSLEIWVNVTLASMP